MILITLPQYACCNTDTSQICMHHAFHTVCTPLSSFSIYFFSFLPFPFFLFLIFPSFALSNRAYPTNYGDTRNFMRACHAHRDLICLVSLNSPHLWKPNTKFQIFSRIKALLPHATSASLSPDAFKANSPQGSSF